MVRESKQERKLERQLLVVIVFVVVIIGLYLVASAYFKSLHRITYEGLTFSKQRATANLTVYHHQYYFKSPTGKLLQYNLYLRNNPFDLVANIPLVGDKVALNPRQPVYFTINNSGLVECPYSTLAVATLASYLSDNQFKVLRGDMNFWTANGPEGEWVTCERKPNSRVIELYRGDETRVSLNGNCYRITVATCEDVLEAVERFIVQSVVDARRIDIASTDVGTK
jgi:hypothetical protein